jgi:hypothetical protein
LALTAAASALAASGLTIGTSKPALAEFEIKESTVEKGEKEFEYRGAVHWGFPKTEREDVGEKQNEGAAAPRKKRRRDPFAKAMISSFPTA